MTENDKKLWEEIENCLEYDYDIYGGDSVFLHTTSIENLMSLFKSKEIDLLKEFVMWEYARYEGKGSIMFADDFAFAIRIDLATFLEGRNE